MRIQLGRVRYSSCTNEMQQRDGAPRVTHLHIQYACVSISASVAKQDMQACQLLFIVAIT